MTEDPRREQDEEDPRTSRPDETEVDPGAGSPAPEREKGAPGPTPSGDDALPAPTPGM